MPPPDLPDLPPHLALAEGRDGVFVVPRGDTYIGRMLLETAEWAGPELDVLRQVLRPGDWVVDGGANLGAHALAFARGVGSGGRVFAVEPQPALLQMLGMSALINGLSNIVPVAAALGEAPGRIDVPPIDYGRQNNFGGLTLDQMAAHSARPGAVHVPVARLDDLLRLDRLRLLKLDLQGFEAAALRGAEATLARHRPLICVECDAEDDAEVLLPLLEGLGYVPHWLVAPLDRPTAATPLFPGVVSVNLLAAPREIGFTGLRRAESPHDHPLARQKETAPR